ncbi:hypothetical protein GCM10023333_36100 [Ferrimonas pelagia]|uniref:Uncharacterized protein n=1 Tax=Ferrimonas pelagia TaxID=1177826 RepID=A0ABP9FJI3_9GAMM
MQALLGVRYLKVGRGLCAEGEAEQQRNKWGGAKQCKQRILLVLYDTGSGVRLSLMTPHWNTLLTKSLVNFRD